MVDITRQVEVKKISFDVKTGDIKVEVKPIEMNIAMAVPEWLHEQGCTRLFRYVLGYAVGRFGEGEDAEWKKVDLRYHEILDTLNPEDIKQQMMNLAEAHTINEEEHTGEELPIVVRNHRQ